MPKKTSVQSTFGIAYRLREKEKDPIIDAAHTIAERTKMELKDISGKGGPAMSTMKGWFDGETLCPQYRTMAAYFRAQGYEFQIVPSRVQINGRGARATAPTIVFREARNGTIRSSSSRF